MSPEEAERAWSALLTRCEEDLERARRGAELGPWDPPAGMPALPASVAPRVRALLAAQADVTRRIGSARTELARALTRNRQAVRRGSATPVYLDSLG